MSSHGTQSRGGGGAPWQLEKARPCAERLVYRQGHSTIVTIPQIFLKVLNLVSGDTVRFTLYEEHGALLIEPVIRRSQIPLAPTIIPPVKVAK
jgi:antitoxin component of MazEF toxin-antitoxin module